MIRGSRKHVLDWTGTDSFLGEMADLIAPVPISFSRDRSWMPYGHAHPEEARLETFGPSWLPNPELWDGLQDWWLAHPAGANTPNWDIVVAGTVERRPALLLVEAKANHPELGTAGKGLEPTASLRSRANHERIGMAIDEACQGWRGAGANASISRDTHYQLSNRLAFAWKLADSGIPVVLLYLGFLGDTGIVDVGPPFESAQDWARAVETYFSGVFDVSAMERSWSINGTPVWVIARPRPVLSPSPSRVQR